LWARFAVILSFLAVFSALAAPASMLAQDVRSGKLGGICTLSSMAASSAELAGLGIGNGDAPVGSHCDLCGVLGLVLPALPRVSIPCFAGQQLASASLPAQLAASVAGLPFSRGPPAL
jgi:hypothetical protein